jgi:hypothetical protein
VGKDSRLKQQRRNVDPPLPRWTPFEEVDGRFVGGGRSIGDVVDFLRNRGISEEDIQESLKQTIEEGIYVNSRYQVNVRDIVPTTPSSPPLKHLSIKCIWNGKNPPGPERWRDFQRIKDELCGPEMEGVELYPARSRLVDTSNQFHIWVIMDPTWQWPFGFEGGFTSYDDPPGGKQQPLEAQGW